MKITRPTITKYHLLLAGIVLIGAALRIYQLGSQSFWIDEAFSVAVSNMSLVQIINKGAIVDFHPPLYYFILHYWMTVFGTSEAALRLLSALFGILAIPAIYLVGRQLFDKEAGLIAALILALSAFNVQYSQELRMYSLMVLLALLSMYCFLRLIERMTLAISIGYVLFTTLLLYTHLYGLFILVAQNIFLITLVLSHRRTVRFTRWVLLQAIVLLLFTPWISILTRQVQRSAITGGVGAAIRPTTDVIVQTFINYSGSPFYSGTIVLLALFAGLSIWSFCTYRKTHSTMRFKAPLNVLISYLRNIHINQSATSIYLLIVWMLAIIVIPALISLFSVRIYADRYTIAASAAFYLLVAKGMSNIHYRPAKLAVLGVIIVLSAASLHAFYAVPTKAQAREAFSFVDAHARSGDAASIGPADYLIVADYYNKRTDLSFKPFGDLRSSNDINMKRLNATLEGHDRVWLIAIDYGSNPHIVQIIQSLNESWNLTYYKHYSGSDVWLFEKGV